jgi:hypothetical protein
MTNGLAAFKLAECDSQLLESRADDVAGPLEHGHNRPVRYAARGSDGSLFQSVGFRENLADVLTSTGRPVAWREELLSDP